MVLKRICLMAFTLVSVLLLGGWTSLSSLTALEVFDRQEPDGLYRVGAHLVQAEPRLEPDMLDHAAGKFQTIYQDYLAASGCRTYLAVIPGKHAFLAGDRPSLDYREMADYLTEKAPFLENIDLTGVVTLADYYRTDVHWKQEELLDVAQFLGDAMGVPITGEDYTAVTLSEDFRGGYLDHQDLPIPPDAIRYLTSPDLAGCTVTCWDLLGRPQQGMVYDAVKARQRYLYDLYLSGPQGLMTLENPNAATDKELILFRDSFGSSLAPLLAQGSAKITLVDLRYMASFLLGEYMDFHGQDVLFLYSSLLLNNSLSLK